MGLTSVSPFAIQMNDQKDDSVLLCDMQLKYSTFC